MTMTRNAFAKFTKAFAKDEDGATAIEYALMIALVGAVIIGSVTTLGNNTNDQFSAVSDAVATTPTTTDP